MFILLDLDYTCGWMIQSSGIRGLCREKKRMVYEGGNNETDH